MNRLPRIDCPAKEREHGSALLLTLTLIVMASALVSALLQLTMRAAGVTQLHVQGMQSFYLQESLQEVLRSELANALSANKCDYTALPGSGTLTVGAASGEFSLIVNNFPAATPPYRQIQSQTATPTLSTASGQRGMVWDQIRCKVGFAPLYAANTDFSQPGVAAITINGGGGDVLAWNGAPTEECTRNVPPWETQCNAVDNEGVMLFVSPSRESEKYQFPAFSFITGASTDVTPTGVYALLPGQYRNITLASSATVNLTPGDYYIDALWVQSGVTAIVQTSGAGTNLHVKFLRNEGTLQINSGIGQPGNVTWYTHAADGVTPPWPGTAYNMEWSSGNFAMEGVIVAASATTAQLSAGSWWLNGAWLSQGTITVASPMTVLYDNAAMTAVNAVMLNTPVHLSVGSLAEK
ncbi:MAG: hypothetical protein HQM05_03580 [Magnetococcales bacterium]|nr:hypothetical protein [Magnetococcales bacterium]